MKSKHDDYWRRICAERFVCFDNLGYEDDVSGSVKFVHSSWAIDLRKNVDCPTPCDGPWREGQIVGDERAMKKSPDMPGLYQSP